MLVPPQYDKELCPLIDEHTRYGLIPNKFVINFFNIAKDLSFFLESKGLSKSSILEIGGKTSPLFQLNQYNITPYEDRKRYQDYISDVFKLTSENNLSLKESILSHEVILIHADYIAELGNDGKDLSHINSLLNKDQSFFVIEYLWDSFDNKITCINDDGLIYDLAYYHEWFNINRSHMHLGYQTEELKNIRVFNFSYFY